MSETITKYAVVNPDDGSTLTTCDAQAPATTLAKRRTMARPPAMRASSTPRLVVEERTYQLVSTKTVRAVQDGEARIA